MEPQTLSDLPVEQRIALMNFAAYRDSFRLFVDEVIQFKMHNPGFLNDVDNVLSNPGYKKVCIAMPRGHGKSQHLSYAFPLWEIAKNHDIRIMIISKTARTSSKFAQQIMGTIENNEKYKAWAKAIDPRGLGVGPKFRKIAGRKVEEKWSSDSFIIDRQDLTLKDPTVITVGLFGSLLGARADLIIADDIVDQVNSQTQDQREKVKRWFYDTVLPCLTPNGRVLYLGNTWMPDDLIADLLQNHQFDYRRKLSAIVKEPDRQDLWTQYGGILLDDSIEPLEKRRMLDQFYFANKDDMNHGAEVLWPEMFPYRDLYAMRLFNSFSFQRMMMCDASMNPNQRVKEEWIQAALKKGEKLRLQRAPRQSMVMRITTGGMDLAISEKDSADYTALLTLDLVEYGMDDINKGDYVVRELESGHLSGAAQRKLVKDSFMDIAYSELRVESVGYQQSLVNDLLDMPGLAGIIKGYKTGGEKNDDYIGVNVISTLFEQGKIVLPWDQSDTHTIKEISDLLAEIRSFPTGHTGDRLMALWFAISAARELTRSSWSFPGMQLNAPLDRPKTQAELDYEADMQVITEDTQKRAEGGRSFIW